MRIEQPSIKGLVGERKMVFKIPEFQRPYSWGPNNAKEFLDDLEECVNNPDRNHYFGTVFYTTDSNKKNVSTVIDGQQRITTVMLMIMAIYHLIDKNPELGKGGDDPHEYYTCDGISDEFLYDSEFSKVKLRTVAYDDSIFEDIYKTGGDHLSKLEKRSNLWQVYKAFYNYFETKEGLNKYINALDCFHIIKLGLDHEDDKPQRVFESINSTGKPLTDGDKIRNFALMLDDEKLRPYVYETYWCKIEHALTDPDKDEITDFFRNYLISKRQTVIQTTEVYTEFKRFFKENVTDQADVKQLDEFYSDIIKYLGYYLLLVLGNKDEEQRFRKSRVPKVALHLRYIRSGLYVPFGMSVLAEHDAKRINATELDEIFGLVETFFSRRLICNISASSLDKLFAGLHQSIVETLEVEPGSKYVEVMKYMLLRRTGQSRLPSDAELKLAVVNNDFYSQRHRNVMYVLCAANDAHRPKSSILLEQVIDKALSLSVEHIMPQTISEKSPSGKKWIAMLGENWKEVHEKYLHTLGNLTVTAYNSEYSNLPYVDEKRPDRSKMHLVDRKGDHVGLADNDFVINQYIANNFKAAWNEKAIIKRQGWWMKSLKKLWPYPTTSFQPTVSDTSVSLLEDRDYTGYRIWSVTALGNEFAINQWSEAIDCVAETLYEQNTKLFKTTLDDEYLSNFIVRSDVPLRGAMQVLDTDFYVMVDNNTNTKVKIIMALAKLFKLEKDDIRADIAPTSTQ